MPFQLVFLLTDVLIYVLLAALIAFGLYTAHHEHLRVPWRQVARRPMAMASLVILLVYVAVGLMDSVHYRPLLEGQNRGEAVYSNEVLSLLDKATKPLRARAEKTYSAPFAMQAYSMETAEYPDGRHVREYPRLLHGGAHVQEAGERVGDIMLRVGAATLAGFGIWLLIVASFLLFWRRHAESWMLTIRRLVRGEGDFPRRSVSATAESGAGRSSEASHVDGTGGSRRGRSPPIMPVQPPARRRHHRPGGTGATERGSRYAWRRGCGGPATG